MVIESIDNKETIIMRKKVSVIIVTYNSEKHIFDCLDSLFNNNDIGDELEVIIVDNMSKSYNETKNNLLEIYGSTITMLQNNCNGGYGQGNNIGIRKATAPIVMIMNPDVRLVQPVFKRAVEVFKNSSVVQYGMQQLDINGNRAYSFAVSSTIHPLIGLPITSICNKIRFFVPRIMYLSGACFFIRKSSFEEIGLFDERLFMYREEDDIHYRLMKRKKNQIVYDKNVGYKHLHGLYSKFDENDFAVEKTTLRNSILINGERGFKRETVIRRQILWTRLFLLKERIAAGFNNAETAKIRHMKSWIAQMREMIS